MLHGLLTMVSQALLLLSGSLYLLSSLTGWSDARPEPFAASGDGHGEEKLHAGAQLGAVASEHDMCSRIGTDMLKKGGNAADAMVATVFCVGVGGMYHSGLGGGGFAVVRAPNGTAEFVDFRETAPAAAFEDMYKDNTDASIYGGLASGVPGELRGLEYLHKSYGSLPWAMVVEPAIRTAREGWPVGEDLVNFMEDNDFLTDDPAWAVDFAPNGTLLGLGDTITRKRYANTLETIAQDGVDAFYSGDMAAATINALKAADGTMTLDDLSNYTIELRPTSEIDYHGYKVAGATAPSSGPIGLSILNILDGYDDFFTPDTLNLSTHRLDEAMRFAYGQRTKFGDPHFVDGLEEYQEEILTDEIASEIRAKIFDERTQNISAYDPSGIESLDTPGTSHISTTDASGLSISLTTTINLIFGSTLIVPETGVIMNNEMNDFSIPGSSNEFGYLPSPANYVRPGKRPLSSMCPIIVSRPDGEVYLVTGAAGGSRIITSTIQSVINVVDRKMTALEALEEPRLHDQLVPAETTFELAFDNSTVAFMRDRGHNISWVEPGQSAVQAVRVLHDEDSSGGEGRGKVFEPAAEPRQADSGGHAA